MNEYYESILLKLKSDDRRVSEHTATFLHSETAEAYCLLPQLLAMVREKHNVPFLESAYGEFVAAGRILQAIEYQRNHGTVTHDMIMESERCIEEIIGMLPSAEGAGASLLIHILALVGPRCEAALPMVAEIASISSDRRLQYRAYQFVSSVCPELSSSQPWIDFAPVDPQERLDWQKLPPPVAQ